MKRAVWRAVFNVYARGISINPPLRTLRSGHLLASSAVLTSLQTRRFYSSGNDKYNGWNSTTNQNEDPLVVDDVSTEELKRKIDKFYEGDVESLPSIFEAILKRKLSGKYEEADHELVKEIRQRMPGQVGDFEDDKYDSDLGLLKETDEEMEDDSSESEEEDRKT